MVSAGIRRLKICQSEGDSKVSLYQVVVSDSSVCDLNQGFFCKVQIHDAALQKGCWDQKEPGRLCVSPSSPDTAQMHVKFSDSSVSAR